MDFQRILGETKRAFRRLARSDFQQEHASEAERGTLARAPTVPTAKEVQDYAAWRRSLLWIAGVALIVLALFELVTFRSQEDFYKGEGDAAAAALERAASEAEQGGNGWQAQDLRRQAEQARQQVAQIVQTVGQGNLETIDGILTFLIIPVLAGGILALVAAVRWTDLRRSRKLARVGFLIMFLTPFALAALPVKEMLEFGHLNEEAQTKIQAAMGLQMGMVYFMFVGPRAVALFPGVIRSSMTLKTLIPESPMTGWAAALVAPLYSIFVLVVFALVMQAYGNLLLLLGIACFIVSPLIYLFRAKDILRPHRAEEVSGLVGRIRRRAAIFNLVGAVLVGIWMIDMHLFGVEGFLKFFLSILGNVVFLTVVGADFLLAVLRAGHQQSKALIESDLEAPLEARFEAFAAAGFGDVRAREEPATAPAAGG